VPENSGEAALESPFVLQNSLWKIVAISAAIFVVAHLALMVGLTTPDKINFDEVHYVPAAKQLLEPGVPNPLLNPMHPPLAKEFMALSIRLRR